MRVTAGPLLFTLITAALGAHPVAQEPVQDAPQTGLERPLFRASVEMVSMAAVVRNRKGRVVRSLSREDFEVLDAGTPTKIVDVRAEVAAPASVALLVDSSGSMSVGDSLDAARLVADEVLNSLDGARDEASLLTFDSRLLELQEFTGDFEPIRMRLEDLDAFGTTSLYDAIAQAARGVASHARNRRAILVLTDCADTSSTMSAAAVSAIASNIEVPVYVFALGSERTEGPLVDLARWTGGEFFVATDRRRATLAIQQFVDELRHQYVLAFQPSEVEGWRRVEIRTRRPGLTVRARTWYRTGAE
jgi:Ca-activated chloride channel family protein